MGDVLTRRREMILASEVSPTPIECPYVTDGLIFWLDGLNQGGVSGQWKDLIGGKVFTLTGCTQGEKGVYFSGSTSSYGVYEGAVSSNNQNETFEACCATTNTFANMCMFCPPNGSSSNPNGIGLVASSSGSGGNAYVMCNLDGVSRAKRIVPQAFNRISINLDRCYANGSSKSTTSNDSWGANSNSSTYLGVRRTTSLSKPYKGTIYSIRIYNRKLSADEMAANQAADVTRFSL